MSEAQITADDIAQWKTLDDIAASLQKRGLEPRPDIERDGGYDDELLMEIEEDRYIALINAGPSDDPTNYNSRQTRTVPTNFVATRDFETFSFIMRERSLDADAHGRITRKQFSFNKSQITDQEGERYSVLDKLNEIEYGNSRSLTALFDTRRVVDEFYEDFEKIRTDLIAKVTNIPDDRGDAKRRFVQVTLNRLIFLHFIQEKGLLGTNDSYLIDQHQKFATEGDVHEDFYQPLFFEALAQKTNRVDFDKVPYLNGGLFSKTPIEQEFSEARLGADAEESADLYGEILEFLDSWNWHVDERLDVVEPKNLSPAVLGHIFEQTVNQKEMGAYYTPEEITSFMARRSIHSSVLEEINDRLDTEYGSIDQIFGIDEIDLDQEHRGAAMADGGLMTQQADPYIANADHVETLYFDVLKQLNVLDPAVGSGAFLLASEDVLLDIYLHSIEYFQQLYDEQPLDVSGRIRDELDAIDAAGSKTLYAKREIILNNLYGVDIDEGAVEICKLRLWLSMVADIENDPSKVDPLPNIDFNIRQGDSLIGFNSDEVIVGDQKLLLTQFLQDELTKYREKIQQYRASSGNVGDLRLEIENLHDDLQSKLNDWYAQLPDITIEENIDDPDDVLSTLQAANGQEVKLKFRFSDQISDKIDQKLNEIGFRTWKTAANLELESSDLRSDRIQTAFDTVSEDDLSRTFVERGLQQKDLEGLSPFHWVMEFPDVYDGSVDAGFDVVMENPPYVRIENIDQMKRDLYKDLNETAQGRCDLYIPFIERSFEFLNESGRAGIITSNQFMIADYGEALRDYLPKNFGLQDVYDFNSYPVFDGITIYTTILIGSRQQRNEINCTSIRSEDGVGALLSSGFTDVDHPDIIEFDMPRKALGKDPWTILPEDERRARKKIAERCSQRLGDDDVECTIGSPLKTGRSYLRAEVTDSREDEIKLRNDELSGWVESGIWKRMIIPDDVERWVNPSPRNAIFFPYREEEGEYSLITEDEFQEKYPKTYSILSEYKEDLLSRKDSRRTWAELGRPWYSLAREGGPEYFERDKIVTDSVVDEPRFCLDTESHLFATGSAATKGITPHNIDIYFLLGYLNSSSVYSYITPIAPRKQGGFIVIDVGVVESIPFPDVSLDEEVLTKVREEISSYEQFEELYDEINDKGASRLQTTPNEKDQAAATVLREVTYILVHKNDTLSGDDKEALEKLNDQLVFDLLELDLTDQTAIDRIRV